MCECMHNLLTWVILNNVVDIARFRGNVNSTSVYIFANKVISIKFTVQSQLNSTDRQTGCLTAPQGRIYPVITVPSENNNSNLKSI